jgi:hypothetical protein
MTNIKTRTLCEMADDPSNTLLLATILEHFASSVDILRVLPFIDVPLIGYDEGLRPERLYSAGGDLDTDAVTVKKYGDMRLAHDLRKAKALAQTIGDAIINGDTLKNARCFDGLRLRTTGSQCITIDGGFRISDLHALLGRVKNPTHLIMPAALRSLIFAEATNPEIGKYCSFTTDEFGRRVSVFKDIPILMSGLNAYNQQVIDFENGGASIYAVNFSAEGVAGIQNDVLSVLDMGDQGDIYRTRTEWLMGLTMASTNSAARLRGIQHERVEA